MFNYYLLQPFFDLEPATMWNVEFISLSIKTNPSHTAQQHTKVEQTELMNY